MKTQVLYSTILATALWLPAPTIAQRPAAVSIGDLVRIEASSLSESSMKGKVTGLGESKMMILRRDSNEPDVIDYIDIQLIEIDRGSNLARGALIGTLLGAVAGIIATRVNGPGGDEYDYAPELFVPAGMAAGLTVGLIVGSRHNWEPVSPLESKPDPHAVAGGK